MLTNEEINQYCSRTRYNRGQVEKDYLQHHVLSFIEINSGNSMVFKGGTCLQKVLALDRFSEDLDFTWTKGKIETKRIMEVANHIETIGYPTEIRPGKETKVGSTMRFLIEGPLFNGRPISRCSITINISNRGDLVLKPVVKRLVPIYHEISPYVVYHMTFEEIMAEKVRALVTRDLARDLYDLHFLLQKGVRPEKSMVSKKLDYYDIKLTKKILIDSINRKKGIWSSELRSLIAPEVPNYKLISKEVKKSLSILLK